MATTTSHALSIAEYEQMPPIYDADGNQLRDELLRGEVIVSPRANSWHSAVANRLSRSLQPLIAFGCEVLVEGPLPIQEDEASSVIGPDVMVVRSDEYYGSLQKTGYVDCVPLLVVEIKSQSNRKPRLLEKAQSVIRKGTPEVWIIYSDPIQIEVFTATGSTVYTQRVPLKNLGFDLVLDVGALFDFSRAVVPLAPPTTIG